MNPRRPLLRWHCGKWLLSKWIISHFPAHRIYVEPFGGAGSVLLRKPPAYAEIWNDLDGEVVNLFRVLQDVVAAAELLRLLKLTPFARAEFELAYQASGDRVERARRLIIRSFMGFGSDSTIATRAAGFRSNANRSGSVPGHDWANYPDALEFTVARLRGVIVECRPAVAVMAQHDSPETLHYVDPPYLAATRSALARRRGGGILMYNHEMTDDDHVAMLADLRRLAGMVVLSGYPHPIYDAALDDWTRVEREAMADGGRPRIEVLWLNPACAAALDREHLRWSTIDIFDARQEHRT